MRFYLSRKIGPWRIGGSMKLTWWNFIFVGIVALFWFAGWLTVFAIELVILCYYYLFKGIFVVCRFCWRKSKQLFHNIKQSKTAGQ